MIEVLDPARTNIPERFLAEDPRLEVFTSMDNVPRRDWDQFAGTEAVNLEPDHLLAVEESRINDISPYYIIGYAGKRAIGIAYCFSINVDLGSMVGEYPPEVLASVRVWKPGLMNLRVVEVGHLASLGRTVSTTPLYEVEFLGLVAGEVERISEREHADLCFIRDFAPEESEDRRVLEENGYSAVRGFPIARIPLRWTSFDGYLQDLKSKKRYSVRKSRRKLQVPEIRVEIIQHYARYSERLSELWANVAKRNNGYSHEHLDPSYFECMCRRLGSRSHVVAIKRYGEIIAYGLNLIGDEEYFGVAEGLDYRFRDDYDLYANNIFEGLRVACNLGKKYYNIGITTYDFKASIGAELLQSRYFVKSTHNPAHSAAYADLFAGITKYAEREHRVFRESEDACRVRSDSGSAGEKPKAVDPFLKHYRFTRVDVARAADLYTYCPAFESAQEPLIRHRGRGVILLGTNSYLGLSTHPEVKQAMHAAIERYGSGCSGSPLLNGTLELHTRLTEALAKFTGKQSALIFSTGFQTNIGTLSALVNRDDVLIMDRRNHASLVDGARLSGASIARYEHNDMDSLSIILDKYRDRPKLIVTDSYFSMEGTVAKLPEIAALAKKYSARLMLDESHAIGVFGETGRGVAEHFDAVDDVDILMGTFSKSFASIGGFIAGEAKILDTLKHTSRPHIFSASLPPSAVAAVLAAIRIVDDEPDRRRRLMHNARFLADGLRSLGYRIGDAAGPIIPVYCGHELLALAAYQKLFDEGVFVNPVTWPAVPKKGELLRVSVMATHDEEMLLRALAAFRRIRTASWPGDS